MPAIRFHKLTSSGGSERNRWVIEPPWDFEFEWTLHNGVPVRDWQEVTVKCRKTTVFADAPFSLDSNFFVSDRLREFLEAEAPGHAQYLPVRMEGPGVGEAQRRYWVVNWLHLLDCLEGPTSAEIRASGTGLRMVVIDAERIPPNVLVGRLKDRRVTTIVRSDLVRKIKKAKFTGPQFYDVWMKTDEGAPDPHWRPDAPDGKPTMPWPSRKDDE